MKTVLCLFGALVVLLGPLAAPASGSSHLTEVSTVLDADLQMVKGGLTEKQFGCGMAVAALVLGPATLGPGYAVAFGWSLSFHGTLFACF